MINVKFCQIVLLYLLTLSPGQEDPLEEDMATHSSILVWRIPWTGEPGGLQYVGLQRVRQDRVTELKLNSSQFIQVILSDILAFTIS